MLKSCSYCGRIHDRNHLCEHKPKRGKQGTDKDKFRSSRAWQRKRDEIRRRDLYLCQICVRQLYDTVRQYTYDELEVHHAISLEDDFNRRLDDDNLITLCERHHEMAERGEIPVDTVLSIIRVQEEGDGRTCFHTPR